MLSEPCHRTSARWLESLSRHAISGKAQGQTPLAYCHSERSPSKANGFCQTTSNDRKVSQSGQRHGWDFQLCSVMKYSDASSFLSLTDSISLTPGCQYPRHGALQYLPCARRTPRPTECSSIIVGEATHQSTGRTGPISLTWLPVSPRLHLAGRRE